MKILLEMLNFASLQFQQWSPIDQLLILVTFIGILFLGVVIYLDNSKNFALKRDWRDKKDKSNDEK